MTNSSEKHRKVAMSYCRHFLTTALRRRERLLATLPKPKRAKPEGADRSASAEAKEQVGAVAVIQDAVNVADPLDPNPAHVHDADSILVDVHVDDDPDVESDPDYETDCEGGGVVQQHPISIVQ